MVLLCAKWLLDRKKIIDTAFGSPVPFYLWIHKLFIPCRDWVKHLFGCGG